MAMVSPHRSSTTSLTLDQSVHSSSRTTDHTADPNTTGITYSRCGRYMAHTLMAAPSPLMPLSHCSQKDPNSRGAGRELSVSPLRGRTVFCKSLTACAGMPSASLSRVNVSR